MQKKIMIYAYTGFNLGDDLFIKILCERYPEAQFILHAPKEYKYSFDKLKNLSIYSSDNLPLRLIRFSMRKIGLDFSPRTLIANRCDAVVHIGGSIFMQRENWNGIQVDKKNLKNKPYFVLGANFGPYFDHTFYETHYELFKRYTDICFRDSYSYELFKDLSNVRTADDIVFQINKKMSNISKKNVVISVIEPSYRKNLAGYDDVYYQKITDVTEYLVEKGYEVTLMSFCKKEGDEEAVKEIMQLLADDTKNAVNKYFYKYNLDEALEIIASSSFMIATRFHAMILGWVYSKPVFPISYSEKMNNVMNDLSYKGSYINLKEIGNLDPEIVYEGMQTNFVDISEQAINAENHFKKLDRFGACHSPDFVE